MQAIAKASVDNTGFVTEPAKVATFKGTWRRHAASGLRGAVGRAARHVASDVKTWVLETPPQAVPRRLPLIAATTLVLSAGAYGATLGGHWAATEDWIAAQASGTASAFGITVDAVSFEGLAELEEADLLPVVMMARGPLDKPLDVAAVKAALLADPWIANVDVRRLFPNRLVIGIEERVPIALLQEGRLELVDAGGTRLGELDGERFASLPVIAGDGAIDATAELKRLMRAASWLPSKPRGAVRVGRRRWNVILQDGSMLRLPARDGGEALARLKALDESGAVLTSALLSGRPIVVDLRFADQVTFSLLDRGVDEGAASEDAVEVPS